MIEFNRPEDIVVLSELKAHILRAHEWANETDGTLTSEGFSGIKSVMEAIDLGRPGLALDRWDSLSSTDRPNLSLVASFWEML